MMVLAGLAAFFCGPAFSAANPFSLPRSSTAPIMIVYPKEGEDIGPVSDISVSGSVSDPEAAFDINKTSVSIYKTGAFLAWIPVQGGPFTLHCRLKPRNGPVLSYERNVFVQPQPAPLSARPVSIDTATISPAVDEELRPGDWLIARFKGSPGGKAWFRLPHRRWIVMREYDPALGLYQGVYQVSPNDDLDPSSIEFDLSSFKARSRAKISFRSGAPKIAVVKSRVPAMIYSEPEKGEMFPVLPAERVMADGRIGGWTRLALSGGESGWIQTRYLDFLPEDSSPPSAATGVVVVKKSEDGSTVHVGLSERVPFEILESDDLSRLSVEIHDAHLHTNWIVYQDDSLVSQVRIRQKSKDLVELTVDLNPGLKIWGTHASFEGEALAIEIRRPPAIAIKPLKGRTIFLDPGHMPSAPGAIGGLGTEEMEVNLAIAKTVASLLEKEGAKPVLSHDDDTEEVGLSDRPRLAWESRADVFVSIHNNNIAPNEDPFKSEHGFSIFYYQPQSLGLARAVEKAYRKLVPLPDEGLRYGNYLVLRMTEMPAILTESAYLSYPEQEALLLSPGFRLKTARAIVSGLRSFFEAQRPRGTFGKTAPARIKISARSKPPRRKPARHRKPKKRRARGKK